MKIIEVIESNVGLGNGSINVNIEIDGNITADVDFHYTSEWNSDETSLIVTECWVQEITLFDDGTKIELPAWQRLEISLFAHGNVSCEYIENVIN